MKGTEDYLSEEEYEAHFKELIKTINELCPLDGYKFGINYAYGGARLVKRNLATGGESNLSNRFYYDEDGTADYDAFESMLVAIINILKEQKSI